MSWLKLSLQCIRMLIWGYAFICKKLLNFICYQVNFNKCHHTNKHTYQGHCWVFHRVHTQFFWPCALGSTKNFFLIVTPILLVFIGSFILNKLVVYFMCFLCSAIQGRLNIWTEDLKAFFLSWKLVEIWKNDTNIIWTSSKNTHFSKVSRL